MGEIERTADELRQEILDRMKCFYFLLDDSYSFPNSREGDLLKMIKDYFDKAQQLTEENERLKKIEEAARTYIDDVDDTYVFDDLAEALGDGGEDG